MNAKRVLGRWAMAAVAAGWMPAGSVPAAGAASAKEAVAGAGVDAGLCVHLGCRDGQTMADLAEGGRFLVHGLAADGAALGACRKYLEERRLYGRASVGLLSDRRLPYADGLVNLLIVEDSPAMLKAGLTIEEMLRVVCPDGVVLLGGAGGEVKAQLPPACRPADAGAWVRLVKPRPARMDEWTHWHYAAHGNMVSADTAAETPTAIRWVAGPEYPRGDRKSSTQTQVSAGGRIFYQSLNDAGNLTAAKDEGRWCLIARDACNGLFLWKQPWQAGAGAGKPWEYMRRPVPLAAAGERVYGGHVGGTLSVLEAATGRSIHAVKLDSTPAEIALAGGAVLVETDRSVYSIDPRDGKVRWRADAVAVDLRADAEGVYYLDIAKKPYHLVCLEQATGKEKWRFDTAALDLWKSLPSQHPKAVSLRFCLSGVVVLAGNNTVSAVSAGEGRLLWTYQAAKVHYDHRNTECHLIAGLVWAPNAQAKGKATVNTWACLDPATGEVRKRVEAPQGGSCGTPVNTHRFMIYSKRVGLLEFATGEVHSFAGARGPCTIYTMPANGMLYSIPQPCACNRSAVRGFLAMAGEKPAPAEKDGRLVTLAAAPPAAAAAGPADWPSYLHDGQRGGSSPAAVPADLRLLWEAAVALPEPGPLDEDWRLGQALGDPLSAPVVAGGLAYVAVPNAHRLDAFDAAGGTLRWSFTAGGPIDSPPTIEGGVCVLGCGDGWVYGLAAADGKELWRFRAAPREKRIVAFGQLESPWPVSGSVLVMEGVAFVSAGRTSGSDGGLNVCALDVRTGRPLWEKQPAAGRGGFSGMNQSVLTTDGQRVFLRGWQFEPKDGANRTAAWQKPAPQYLRANAFSLLKAPWRRMPVSLHKHIQEWDYGPASGLLLAHDDKNVYGCRLTGATGGGRGWVMITAAELFAAPRGADPRAAKGWSLKVPEPMQVEALIKAGEHLFAAGPENKIKPAAARLWIISAADGKIVREIMLPAPPVFCGLAAAGGSGPSTPARLFIAGQDGKLRCFGKEG